MRNTSRTNWERVDALTDEEIDTSEAPALDERFFERAQWHIPAPPMEVTVPIDSETLAWFEAQEGTGQQQMSAALRIYAEAHKAAARAATEQAEKRAA